LATQPGVILYYLRLSLWPSPLCWDRAWPVARTWMGIVPPTIALLILLGASACAWKRNPVWGFVGAWFFLILAPSSSFIPLHEMFYEHRMYLSLAAVVSLAVMGSYSLMGRKCLILFAAAAIGLGFLTRRRNQDYQSEVTLRADAVAKFPNDPATVCKLGLALQSAGRIQEAVGYWEQVLQLNPDYADAHNNLGIVLGQAGKINAAIDHFQQAVRINPDFALAHNNLAAALGRVGRVAEAIRHSERALQINPDYAEAYDNLGNALTQEGKVEEAIGQYEQALRLRPDYAEAHYNLGVALIRLGRVAEAISHWEEAVRIKPQYASAHYSLGIALERSGRAGEAIAEYERVLEIRPDQAEVRNRLGVVLAGVGRVREAIGQYEQALRLRPGYAEAGNNLAWLLATLTSGEGGDPVRAVTLAQQACETTGNRAAPYLDTLAVAYAAAGHYPEAVATAEKAIELASAAGQRQLAGEIETRLELYRSRRAYRRPQTQLRG